MYQATILSEAAIIFLACSILTCTAEHFYIGERNETTETDHIRGTISSHRGFPQISSIKYVNSAVRVTGIDPNVTDVMMVKFNATFDVYADGNCNGDKLYVDAEGQNRNTYCSNNEPPTEEWIPYYIKSRNFTFHFVSLQIAESTGYSFSLEYLLFQKENYTDGRVNLHSINIANAWVLNLLNINIIEFSLANSGDCADALRLTGVKSAWTADGNSVKYCNTAAALKNMKYFTTNETAVQISFETDGANSDSGFLLHYTVQSYGCSTRNFGAYSKISLPDEEGKMKAGCMVEGGGQTSEWIKCIDSSWQHDPQGTASPSNCFNKLVDISTTSIPTTASTQTTPSIPNTTSSPKTSGITIASMSAVTTSATATSQSDLIPTSTAFISETETKMPGREEKDNIYVIIGGASGGGVIIIIVLVLIILVVIRKRRQGTEMKQSTTSELNHYVEEARAGSGHTGSSSAYGHTLRGLEYSVGGGEYDLADSDYQLAGPTGEEYENSASIQRIVNEREITDEYASVCASTKKQPTQNTDSVELVENDLYDS